MAEGGGLLNRYRIKSSIGGSNPPLSAIYFFKSVCISVRMYISDLREECLALLPAVATRFAGNR